jgi:hypothetical protein
MARMFRGGLLKIQAPKDNSENWQEEEYRSEEALIPREGLNVRGPPQAHD